MTETKTKDEKKAPAMFDLASIKVDDTAEMALVDPNTGDPTDWKITFAGPTHAATIKLRNETQRAAFREMRKSQSRRYRDDDADDSKDDVAENVVKMLLARTLGWSDVTFGGEPYPFTEENARKLYRGNPLIRAQALNFLSEDANFLQKAARS